jgi:hypothetical protein
VGAGQSGLLAAVVIDIIAGPVGVKGCGREGEREREIRGERWMDTTQTQTQTQERAVLASHTLLAWTGSIAALLATCSSLWHFTFFSGLHFTSLFSLSARFYVHSITQADNSDFSTYIYQ